MKRLQYVRTMENSDSRQESVESQLRVKCRANQTPVVENVCGLSQNSSGVGQLFAARGDLSTEY